MPVNMLGDHKAEGINGFKHAKPIDLEQLRRLMEPALRERPTQSDVVSVRKQPPSRFSLKNIITKNARMLAVFELIHRLADTTSTVLIEGETGTGKEQVARAIHQMSRSRSGPLIAVNCGALPENLLESELFGHEKGAFTNAVGMRRGRFELADGGTVFLDEIGDVPAPMQTRLLRVLQERCFERVGGAETIEVDVRVIAASNRFLARLVEEGPLREDLFYRLNVIKIELPPLRERAEDIPLLAAHFAEKYAFGGQPTKQIAPAAMQVLLGYHWPGNIRELENAIERASVTSNDEVIGPDNLPPELTALHAPKNGLAFDVNSPLTAVVREAVAQVERQYLENVLKTTHGHVGRSAAMSGLSRRSITAKLAKYNLNRFNFKETGIS
jgi:DNA-binding NtrC family response regulator